MTRPPKPNRVPVDKLSGMDTREEIWASIRQLKTFRIADIMRKTMLEITTVRNYLAGLTIAGYLEKNSDVNPALYTLVRDVGVDAPRVRKDGSPVTQGEGRANMWRTMRIISTFSAKELAIKSSAPGCVVKHETAKEYCRKLCQAGYLVKIANGRYRFLPDMFTGPRPPMVQRVKRVYDPNLKKVMFSQAVEDGVLL